MSGRKRKSMQTFASWISLAENQAARLAVEQVGQSIGGQRSRQAINPLYLCGPTGTGKSHLVSALLAAVVQQAPDLRLSFLPARDLEGLFLSAPASENRDDDVEDLAAARRADLLVVEDLQHLSTRVVEAFVHLVDSGLRRQQQLVFTALSGPAELTHLPARLTSRLGSGLVVGLAPLGPSSRLTFLQQRAARRGIDPERLGGLPVLAWLADHLPGSARQLDGALTRLEERTRLQERPPDWDQLLAEFQIEADRSRPTVERIAQRVGHYFQVQPRELKSRDRSRNTLLPRQVGMYLARQLTPLSLQQIGAYFGGRDHSTVLHACRKVELALRRDIHLSGAVRQLHADLA
jgi:chromosomal replication initiator protein